MQKPRILIVDGQQPDQSDLAQRVGECESVSVASLWKGISLLTRESFAGVFVDKNHLQNALQAGNLLQNDRILDSLPDAVALMDQTHTVLFANATLRSWCGLAEPIGSKFEQLFAHAETVGSLSTAFERAFATGEATTLTMQATVCHGSEPERRHFRLHATPVYDAPCNGRPQHLTLLLRDITVEVEQQHKLVAIHKAGAELADLTPSELADMTVEERVNLLKENILRSTKDLLQFDFIEVRLLHRETQELVPLLSVGMQQTATHRRLYANAESNGVTGWVAATGKSYLCEDTGKDPYYIEGAKDAKSTLTVPLMMHDEVIGTFNVESPQPRAFGASDLQFLEIFARDVATSLHTLDLLVAEKANSTARSVEAIHSAVALPIDVILNDAVMVMESYIGHEPQVVERLRRILKNARDIKQVIQTVGRKMTPTKALPVDVEAQDHPHLIGREVLVVDADEAVRTTAHQLLERYGCIVETAHDGEEAIVMARAGSYQAIISDIKLPDMSGYRLLTHLQTILPEVPLILMTGFGYDPGHTIVKARQAGVRYFLYKPFRLDQLLDTVTNVEGIPGTIASEESEEE